MPRMIGRRKPNDVQRRGPGRKPRVSPKPSPKPSPKRSPRQSPRPGPKRNIAPAQKEKEKKEPSFEKIDEIDINRLVPNPKQPRKEFGDVDKIQELARSIEQEGLIQPIIVRRKGKGNKFEIVVGERRWRACKVTGIRKIPVIVRNVNDHQLMLQSLIENLHRKDLTSVEREDVVYDLWKSGKFINKKEVADALGFAKSTVNEIIEAKEFRDRSGSAAELSTRVITQTRGIKDDVLRAKVIEKIHEDQISSNEVRKFVKKVNKAPQHEQKKLLKENYKIDYEEQDVIEDEDQQELEKEKENTFITQIQRLDRTLDEFVGLDQSFLGSLTKNEKKDLKVKLGAIAVKLDTVMKKL